jgi:hypothetical protein
MRHILTYIRYKFHAKDAVTVKLSLSHSLKTFIKFKLPLAFFGGGGVGLIWF